MSNLPPLPRLCGERAGVRGIRDSGRVRGNQQGAGNNEHYVETVSASSDSAWSVASSSVSGSGSCSGS